MFVFLKKIALLLTIFFLIGCSSFNIDNYPPLPKKLVYIKSIKLNIKPEKIIFNNESNTYVALGKNHNSIYIYNDDGHLLHELNRFSELNKFSFISDISLDSAGNIYALDRDFNKILKFDEMGQFISSISLSRTREPELLKIKSNGDFLIYDSFSNEIYGLSYTRQLRYNFGKFELISPVKISSSLDFNYVLDTDTNSILIFDNFGSLITNYTTKTKILSIGSSKYFLTYLNSKSEIYPGKQDYIFQKPLVDLSKNHKIKNPEKIFMKNSGLGIIDNNTIHLFQFSKSK